MNIFKLIEKFKNSPKGKLFRSIFVLVFSMILVGTSAYAWFSNNSVVGSNGLAVTIVDENAYSTYSAYFIEDVDTKAVGKINQSFVAGNYNLNISLMPYDLTFKSINQYDPVVVRILVYELSSKFIPVGNATKHLSIVLTRDTALDDGTSSMLGGVFSSVGQVDCYTSSSLALNATNKTIYDTIVAQYRNDNSLRKFTTVNNNVITKTSLLDIDIAYTANDFKTDEYSKKCLVLYMVIDYNEDLAELYARQNGENLGTMNSLVQRFEIANDLERIDVDFVESD